MKQWRRVIRELYEAMEEGNESMEEGNERTI